MDIGTAPPVADESQPDDGCPLCGRENPYVLYDGDKLCRSCGHVPGAASRTPIYRAAAAWQEWHEHRRENDEYSGWTGENRIRMVGGFASSYF